MGESAVKAPTENHPLRTEDGYRFMVRLEPHHTPAIEKPCPACGVGGHGERVPVTQHLTVPDEVAIVDVTIDAEAIAYAVARNAARNRTGRARAGTVRAKVVDRYGVFR